NVLQLTNSFAGNAEFLTHFLERFRFTAVKTEALENDFLLAIIEHVEQAADFVAQILVAQKLERRLRVLVPADFAEPGRILSAHRRVERSRTNRNRLQLRNFARSNADFLTKLIVGRL